MKFNNEDYLITKVEANYGYWITIFSNEDIKFTFSFKSDINLDNIDKNVEIDLNNYIHWDVGLFVKGTNYVFDISKDKVILTRLDDNKYLLKVDVIDPDMIYPHESFNNLQIETEFSFNYDYKPTPDKSILDVEPKGPQPNIFDVLDKL